jgi:hypothetical protein
MPILCLTVVWVYVCVRVCMLCVLCVLCVCVLCVCVHTCLLVSVFQHVYVCVRLCMRALRCIYCARVQAGMLKRVRVCRNMEQRVDFVKPNHLQSLQACLPCP